MKKLLKILGVMAVMMTLLTTVAFGAVGAEVGTGLDGDGNNVTISVNPATKTITEEEAINAIKAMGFNATEVTIIYQQDLSVPSGTKFPVVIPFDISGVTEDQMSYVFHWNGSTWVVVGMGQGDEAYDTFESLSPASAAVAVVGKVEVANNDPKPTDSGTKPTDSNTKGTDSNTKSYNTGAANYAPLAIIVALAAMGAACIVYKREALL
jgi:hypothetical protein